MEKAVPAWPIPIHHTKLIIPQPQATELFKPQEPIPCDIVTYPAQSPAINITVAIDMAIYHHLGGLFSTGFEISSEIWW